MTEPPASSAEQSQADALAGADGWETLQPAAAPTPAAADDGLARGVSFLARCAASVRDHAALTNTYQPSESDVELFPGEFRLCRILGRGGFGVVWEAEDLLMPRQVAIKALRAGGAPKTAADRLEAMRKEAATLLRCRHPNVVQVIAWKRKGDENFLILECVTGGSLHGRTFDWPTAARYVADVGTGLLEVHRHGIIHRDIKPANILLDTARDEAMVCDFGISATLTEPGKAAGTPAYMAPEAHENRVSPALDVYSLAATFYYLLVGQPPFAGTTIFELIHHALEGLPTPDPRLTGVPAALEDLIRRGLSADPAGRPPLKEFVDTLRAELNRLLADTLPAATPAAPVVQVRVFRRDQPVTPTVRPPVTRDMKRVPKPPPTVALRTGDEVRVEVACGRDGYLTVFNVGPTGNLNLLYPDDLPGPTAPPNVRAGAVTTVADVQMVPPTGRERVCAVWSRRPLPLTSLASLADREPAAVPREYVATRDMKRVQRTVQQLPPDDVQAAVLELDHGA